MNHVVDTEFCIIGADADGPSIAASDVAGGSRSTRMAAHYGEIVTRHTLFRLPAKVTKRAFR